MTILKFKCELLSDVILNQKAATEGPNQTLDFIPGSNFLGIVAGQLYPKPIVTVDGKKEYDKEEIKIARLMFHSNAVRFGDAHPAHGSNRSLRIPASLFYAKGEKEDEREFYVHHAITSDVSQNINERNIQLKQERSGFVDFINIKKGNTAIRLKQQTNFAIKSAYDADKRRSKDSQMYGYQAMEKGCVFYFSVEIDESMLKGKANDITKALIGIKHIGRSRSAQYGLVEISQCDYNNEIFQKVESVADSDNSMIVVYAESRLIFLDDYGQTTYQPSVKQLLGNDESGMEIDWSKTQIRIFKYAPYNYIRRCFDTDRCGIEKGSVIVLRRKTDASKKTITLPQWVGSYQNEGFGKVIFNPPFLCADAKAKLTYKIRSASLSETKNKVIDPQTPLTKYIRARKEREELVGEIYKKVNEWVSSYGKAFYGNTYASQWGTIRNIAMMSSTREELKNLLFRYNEQNKTGGYLVHGVAKEKWENHVFDLKEMEKEKKKLPPFMQFVEDNTPEHVVNLASMMQKECDKNKKEGGKKDEYEQGK